MCKQITACNLVYFSSCNTVIGKVPNYPCCYTVIWLRNKFTESRNKINSMSLTITIYTNSNTGDNWYQQYLAYLVYSITHWTKLAMDSHLTVVCISAYSKFCYCLDIAFAYSPALYQNQGRQCSNSSYCNCHPWSWVVVVVVACTWHAATGTATLTTTTTTEFYKLRKHPESTNNCIYVNQDQEQSSVWAQADLTFYAP